MNLILAGLSHKTSTVEVRSLFQINRKELGNYLQAFKSEPGVEGSIILSTCNRVEFYMVTTNNINPLELLERFYLKNLNVDIKPFINAIYLKEEIDTARHLFRVVSGLDSLVIGEYQIQGQVKEAYSIACEAKTPDKILHKLFHAAFRTGKRVRSETAIAEGRHSVAGAAAGIITDKLEPSDTITIAGVNESTKIIASKLKEKGFSNFIFVNRTLYKAEMLAGTFGGKAMPLDKITEALSLSKAFFSCTGAPGYIVTSSRLNSLHADGCCPDLIIDMAIPKDVETTNLTFSLEDYDLGSLQNYLEELDRQRKECLPLAEKIIEDELDIFKAWSENRDNNILHPFVEKLECIRQQVFDEYSRQFPDQDYEKLEKLTRHLVHRLQSVFMKAVVVKE